MNNILFRARMLNKEIKRSPEYKDYNKYGQMLQDNRELYSRFNEMRMKKYRLQSMQNQNTNEEGDRLMQEYADIFQDETVRQFLVAEQRLCSIMKEVLMGISDTLDFDLDFLQL
jgi:cell fate (sporulation/competence/biofilm development) regulator YlbF (YheA/YmcA/DUF963 family)